MKSSLLGGIAVIVFAGAMTVCTSTAALGAPLSGPTVPLQASLLKSGTSDHSYRSRVNTICRKSLSHVNQLVATYNSSSHTVGDFLTLLTGEVQGSKSELRTIKAISRPKDIAAQVGTATSNTQALINDSRSVIAGVTLLDQSAPWSSGAAVPSGSALSSNINTLNQVSNNADAAFLAAGLKACAQDPNPTT